MSTPLPPRFKNLSDAKAAYPGKGFVTLAEANEYHGFLQKNGRPPKFATYREARAAYPEERFGSLYQADEHYEAEKGKADLDRGRAILAAKAKEPAPAPAPAAPPVEPMVVGLFLDTFRMFSAQQQKNYLANGGVVVGKGVTKTQAEFDALHPQLQADHLRFGGIVAKDGTPRSRMAAHIQAGLERRGLVPAAAATPPQAPSGFATLRKS